MKDIAENRKGNTSFLVVSSFINALYEKSYEISSLKLHDGGSIVNTTSSKIF